MNFLINLAAKLAGIKSLLSKLDGAKTYIAGAILLLNGLSGLLQEAMGLIDKHDVAAILDFAKQLPSDPCLASIGMGLAAVGLRHAIAKRG